MRPLATSAALIISALSVSNTASAETTALLPAQATQSGSNWADETTEFASLDASASREACRRVRTLEPPDADWPDDAEQRALNGCSSAALYYGVGQDPDPLRARHCALLEARQGDYDRGPFAGLAILMMIYANGFGVERDLDLATSLACRIDGAPAEVGGRVEHIQHLGPDVTFDFCDDITSGLAAGLCASRDAWIAGTKRENKLDSFTATLSPELQDRFVALRDAANTYAETSGSNEVDLSGTARAVFVIERRESIKWGFVGTLDGIEDGSLILPPPEELVSHDRELNEAYALVMAIESQEGAEDRLPYTTVTKQGIRESERRWLEYREAWVEFAAGKYPHIASDGLRAELTRRRTEFLAGFIH
ncbi:lysozyme inhibitor LprI family protein [Qingshengfaniella alkalisoli]|uniref:DUF1311 domain-containing protein n=1 Tax=Qingshengfaniella alkalisoli TaxID=2599296 RepID=A0A5B8J7D5_9RHOB|nr:lysozyme inhibitor LprI family protein [Qingshengfaniella alkalisoli]QDY70387.1 DUF1311 domain-containing protein [Qingshengfaniella alkalisoli]